MSKYVILCTKGYIFMKTRVDKYIEDTENFAPRRVSKNTNLYEEIKQGELETFNIGSNAKVIGEHDQQIDLDKIKDILEKNYQETPKKRSMKFETIEEEIPEIEKTREYDINAILEQAREEKEVDYEKERLKKIRDTQYDILKNLELEAKNKAEEKTKEQLLDLINTINLNEVKKKKQEEVIEEEITSDLDPLDILSDLKGEDNTVVAGAKEFTEEMKALETKEWNTKELKEEELEEKEEMDNSFYTNSMSFNKKDFSDFEDLNEKESNIVVKILIVVVFLAIVTGIVIFLNEFLKLGWF